MPRYTDEQLREAVARSVSLSAILNTFGLSAAGGNYSILKRRIRALGLDTRHFLGQAHLKGKRARWVKGIDLEQLLVAQCPHRVTTFKLKGKLLRAGVFRRECSGCGLAEWRGRPIPLELDHVNGDRTDNRLHNLRLLCPNCHALTPTYRSLNTDRRRTLLADDLANTPPATT